MSKAKFLPAPVTGVALTIVLIVNTLFFGAPVIVFCLAKLLMRLVHLKAAEGYCTIGVMWVAQTWMKVNLFFVRLFIDIDWDIQIEPELSEQRSYLITCNHQSWVDILALYQTTMNETSFLRFFIKDQLKYIPILGLAWWGLDFPFMKRHSKELLAKRPELKGKDLETTRLACDRFRGRPVSILNFLEGTRFKAPLHAKQQSPYKHLLKPKAGGLAFAVGAMGTQLHSLLSVTIAYPQGVGELWDFLCGRVEQIVVRVREHSIPTEFLQGSYHEDPAHRLSFQQWVDGLWQAKDQELQALLALEKSER